MRQYTGSNKIDKNITSKWQSANTPNITTWSWASFWSMELCRKKLYIMILYSLWRFRCLPFPYSRAGSSSWFIKLGLATPVVGSWLWCWNGDVTLYGVDVELCWWNVFIRDVSVQNFPSPSELFFSAILSHNEWISVELPPCTGSRTVVE